MPDYPDTSIALVRQCAEKYADATMLRAAVQLLPYIGGTIDTLIGGAGQKIQQRRMAHFLDELDKRLKNIKEPKNPLAQEDLYDLMVITFEQIVKTRSEEKRVRFSRLIVNEIANPRSFEDVEAAIQLVSELNDIHIQILSVVLNSSFAPYPRNEFRIRPAIPPLKGNAFAFPVLSNLFQDIPEPMLDLFCSELVSKSLLYETRASFVGSATGRFIATSLAVWLFTWIDNENKRP